MKHFLWEWIALNFRQIVVILFVVMFQYHAIKSECLITVYSLDVIKEWGKNCVLLFFSFRNWTGSHRNLLDLSPISASICPRLMSFCKLISWHHANSLSLSSTYSSSSIESFFFIALTISFLSQSHGSPILQSVNSYLLLIFDLRTYIRLPPSLRSVDCTTLCSPVDGSSWWPCNERE